MTHATNTSNPASSVLAFIAGVGLGTAAALLFAPRTGQDTRTQLKEKAKDAKQKMVEKLDDEKQMVADKVSDAADKATEAIDQAAESGKDTAETVKRRTRRAAEADTTQL
jgi:gas vesicle protein